MLLRPRESRSTTRSSTPARGERKPRGPPGDWDAPRFSNPNQVRSPPMGGERTWGHIAALTRIQSVDTSHGADRTGRNQGTAGRNDPVSLPVVTAAREGRAQRPEASYPSV
ncbi:hypothetical protein M197_gp01 [Haloarcula hispanica tailed virus 2]|uniref:Uncharacterized protein n=1 Tax=Haloarcula hispanica tailed virus 2 TaxID=1273751 RepID=R4TM62_9CAUD|nr:hypothetical protein M197_gp01 [Haloarcula hispanica tailed virus 2]AGM11253.1 hypothetical protein HHTV2_1 [Haloarcula hispanica tailed virus 2]